MTRLEQFKAVFKSDGFRKVRKIVVLIVGGSVVLAGAGMLILPGPALVVIPAGFAILATEFDWARRWARTVMQFVKKASSKKNIKAFVHANSLSLTLFLLFFIFLGGQILTGHRTYNAEQELRGATKKSLLDYALSGHSIEATIENWESEFLQMGALVLLTVFLRQKGAADSKEVNKTKRRNETTPREGSPWPLWRGGWMARIYGHSLSLALFGLFGLSFLLHAIGGAEEHNESQLNYGGDTVSVIGYVATPKFWFESFQNWQSEFLSVGVLLLLSIFLREKGSPESKLVNAPHRQTGRSG